MDIYLSSSLGRQFAATQSKLRSVEPQAQDEIWCFHVTEALVRVAGVQVQVQLLKVPRGCWAALAGLGRR